MSDRRSNRFVWFLLLSLLLHSLILFLMPRPAEEKPPQELAALDVEILKQPKRIADILKPKQEQQPERADFLGMYDSRVKEQQVAPSPPVPGVPKPRQAEQKTADKQETKGEKDLASIYAMKREQAKQKQPQSAESSWRQQGALPEDFYPDYKIGPHTYLNVLRFPQIQYFVRMKRIFKMTFNPSPSLRPYVFTNQISRGHVEVVLAVTVDARGRLSNLFVINSSGLKEYDSEAIRTVRDSAPFKTPPKEILGQDGKLRMSWTFTVYL